jgi:hypothetical protein
VAVAAAQQGAPKPIMPRRFAALVGCTTAAA